MNTRAEIDGAPVGAVVVTYFPDRKLEFRLTAIRREFNPVVIVDNSADAAVRPRLEQAAAEGGFTLISNPANVGLATALNQGFAWHAERGARWAAAFDQDSMPAEGFGQAAAAAAQRPPRPAIVGANWTDEAHPDRPSLHLRPHPQFPLFFQRIAATRDLEDATGVIASGSLFNLAVWAQLSGFDDDLFLDLVDTDYCLRAARRGHAIRVAAHARLHHRRGAKRKIEVGGVPFYPAHMPPLRLQYLFRNRVRLLARHGPQAPHVFAFELAYSAKVIAEILVFEDQKIAKLAACICGLWDGFAGRKGAIPEPAKNLSSSGGVHHAEPSA